MPDIKPGNNQQISIKDMDQGLLNFPPDIKEMIEKIRRLSPDLLDNMPFAYDHEYVIDNLEPVREYLKSVLEKHEE